MATETRDFKMHQKLLSDVIMRQAGSIEKAVLEGVMNSIEAGATKVDVMVKEKQIAILDDGKGFESEDQIKLWFETFGQPHEESENKRWAQFRMGRGQLFAFGQNTWRTRTFRMDVDIREKLGYEWTKGLNDQKGCIVTVNLFEPLSVWSVNWTAKQILKQVRYVNARVTVNGEQVSLDPAKEKWDQEDENAYYRLGTKRGLEVYNLGVFVCEIPEHKFGCSGVIVSKKQLMVNFARNDILMSKCPVWKQIQKIVDSKDKMQILLGKRKLSKDERTRLIDLLVSGELTLSDVWESPLLLDVSGHPYSFASLNHYRKSWPCWSYGPALDFEGDMLLQTRQALVLDQENVELFIPAIKKREQLMSHRWPGDRNCGHIHSSLRYIPLKDLKETVDNEHVILPPAKWSRDEMRWVHIARAVCGNLEYLAREQLGEMPQRRILIGLADPGCYAWTDGKTHITLNRRWLAKQPLFRSDKKVRVDSVVKVGQTVLHELCHDGDSLEDRHTPEFYQTYHDCSDALAAAVQKLFVWHFVKLDSFEADVDKEIRQLARGEEMASNKKAAARRKPKPAKKAKKKAAKKTKVKKHRPADQLDI